MMNIDELDSKYEEFLINRKIYLQKGINQSTACQMMGVSIEELDVYLKDELNTSSFDVMIDDFRIAEAKDIWDKRGTTPICQVAQMVGYSNALVFLFRFWQQEHCLPCIWKRRMLVTL